MRVRSFGRLAEGGDGTDTSRGLCRDAISSWAADLAISAGSLEGGYVVAHHGAP